MLAKVNGVFRISKDIELKYLPSGSAIAKVGLVNSAKYKTQTGEQKEDTCFIDGIVFGKPAEVINQYCKKGSKIFVSGDLNLEQWVAQDGSNKSKHSIKIKEFEFLDTKSGTQQQSGGQNSYKQQQQQNNDNGGPNIYNDDIPF